MITDQKFVTREFFGRKRRIKLIRVVLPNGRKYWVRPFQLQLIEKDLKYMEKVNH